MDTHLPTATVREALLFSAKLRQPASVPIEEKEAWVDKCLKMCGLKDYADAVVGSLGVEQRKRTTIGVELVAKPSLIFLDEPTSGLDSQSAWAIVCFLRSLADAGQSIVCTYVVECKLRRPLTDVLPLSVSISPPPSCLRCSTASSSCARAVGLSTLVTSATSPQL